MKIAVLVRAALLRTAATAAVVACAVAVGEAPREAELLGIVRRYADAMIRDARDTYGAEHSPLFAAALDRRTGRLLDPPAVAAVKGLRDHDRALRGANPQHDAPLYAILYELSRRSVDDRYAAEADRALAFFLQRCASPKTALLPGASTSVGIFETSRRRGSRNTTKCGWSGRTGTPVTGWLMVRATPLRSANGTIRSSTSRPATSPGMPAGASTGRRGAAIFRGMPGN